MAFSPGVYWTGGFPDDSQFALLQFSMSPGNPELRVVPTFLPQASAGLLIGLVARTKNCGPVTR